MARRQAVTGQGQVVRGGQDADLLVARARERGDRCDRERAGRLPVAHGEGACGVDVDVSALGTPFTELPLLVQHCDVVVTVPVRLKSTDVMVIFQGWIDTGTQP